VLAPFGPEGIGGLGWAFWVSVVVAIQVGEDAAAGPAEALGYEPSGVGAVEGGDHLLFDGVPRLVEVDVEPVGGVANGPGGAPDAMGEVLI